MPSIPSHIYHRAIKKAFDEARVRWNISSDYQVPRWLICKTLSDGVLNWLVLVGTGFSKPFIKAAGEELEQRYHKAHEETRS